MFAYNNHYQFSSKADCSLCDIAKISEMFVDVNNSILFKWVIAVSILKNWEWNKGLHTVKVIGSSFSETKVLQFC